VTGDGDAPERVYKIYIDQGHNPTGYHNSGASKEGVYEENITYVVGAALAELLSADERFEVRLSRPTPETVLGVDGASSLEARVQGAKDFGADYFISIHANSYSGVEDVWGYECFTLTTDAEMKAFGSTVLNGLHKEINTRNRGLKDGGSLHVIKNAAVPAMLIELGFLTNETERTYMTAAPGRYASAIYAGIVDFIENVKPISFPDAENE
jgi:N-acetylmuramoyl-L-alanine amidase